MSHIKIVFVNHALLKLVFWCLIMESRGYSLEFVIGCLLRSLHNVYVDVCPSFKLKSCVTSRFL